MADLPPSDPGFAKLLAGLMGPAISAAVGVAMRHARMAYDGRPISWRRVLLDMPTVLGMAIAGGAIGDYFGLSEMVRWGLAGLLGYAGPPVLDRIIARYLPPPQGGA